MRHALINPMDVRGARVEVFTLPAWRVNLGTGALAALFLVAGVVSFAVNGADATGTSLLVAGALTGLVVWRAQRRAPYRLAIYEKGFDLGRRFVPWEMIELIETATLRVPFYTITLAWGGGCVFLPRGESAERAVALIEDLRRRLDGRAG
jgi:hypothetical protein